MANPEHVRLARAGANALADWRRTAHGERLDLSDAEISGIDLRQADLRRAVLDRCDLRGGDLRNADLRRGSLEGADLSEAKLGGVNLRYTNMRRATLVGTNLSHAELGHASLEGASLRRANFDHAQLGHTKLGAADLTEANLSHSWLRRTGMTDTVFDRARFEGTVMLAVDLSKARGLAAVRAAGPSSLDLETILKSHGGIPDAFVRACGYDPRIQRALVGTMRERIEAATELAREGESLSLPSCFISYSSADQEFVDRLQQALNERGVDSWYAPEDGRWGQRLTTQIDREISLRERVILVCSDGSLGDSRWVPWELEKALAKQDRLGATVVFPIMIDDALDEWDHPNATALRQILAGDFRHATSGEAFDRAVERLLEGLRNRH